MTREDPQATYCNQKTAVLEVEGGVILVSVSGPTGSLKRTARYAPTMEGMEAAAAMLAVEGVGDYTFSSAFAPTDGPNDRGYWDLLCYFDSCLPG